MGLILDLNTLTRPDILDQQKQKVPVHLDMSRGLIMNRLLDAIFFTRVSISWTVVWVKSPLEACVLRPSSSVDLESHFPRCLMSRMVLLTTRHLPAWLSCQSFSQACSFSRYIRILNKGIFLFCLFVCISLLHPHIVAEETPTPTPTQKVFASGWTYFGLTWNLVKSRFGKY